MQAYQCDRCSSTIPGEAPSETITKNFIAGRSWNKAANLYQIDMSFSITVDDRKSGGYYDGSLKIVDRKLDICPDCFKICLADYARMLGLIVSEKPEKPDA